MGISVRKDKNAYKTWITFLMVLCPTCRYYTHFLHMILLQDKRTGGL